MYYRMFGTLMALGHAIVLAVTLGGIKGFPSGLRIPGISPSYNSIYALRRSWRTELSAKQQSAGFDSLVGFQSH